MPVFCFQFMLLITVLVASGCVHAQTGPLIGVSSKHGPVVGWEAGAGLGVVSGSLGAELRPWGEHVAALYAVAEPALVLPLRARSGSDPLPDRYVSAGGTLGATVDEDGNNGWVVGGWGGAPWIVSGDCASSGATVASVTLGVHVFIGDDEADWTFYGSPKLGMLSACPDLRYASQ